jgi:hypothetical protein
MGPFDTDVGNSSHNHEYYDRGVTVYKSIESYYTGKPRSGNTDQGTTEAGDHAHVVAFDMGYAGDHTHTYDNFNLTTKTTTHTHTLGNTGGTAITVNLTPTYREIRLIKKLPYT